MNANEEHPGKSLAIPSRASVAATDRSSPLSGSELSRENRAQPPYTRFALALGRAISYRRDKMMPKTIRDVLRRSPFKPFTLLVDNGLNVAVTHPECMLMGQSSCVVLEPNEHYRFLDYNHISGLSRTDSVPKPRRRKSRGR